MNVSDAKPGLVGLAAAFAASLCCVLPLTIVLMGLGSGAFMMVTMQFRPILYPLGLAGLAAGAYLYFREKRACNAKGCRMARKGLNRGLLALAAVLMVIVTYVDFFIVSL